MPYTVNELNSARYTGQLVDETGAGFGAVTSLTLTLYDLLTLGIINGRNGQNVLNANQVTFDTVTGALQWDVLPLDNVIVNDALRVEEHRALFVAKWSGAAKQMNHEVVIRVANLRKLP